MYREETETENLRVYAEIDLSAAAANMRAMRAVLPEKTEMLGVVKADGYGHGAIRIAKTIEKYVCGFAVATAEEALELKEAIGDKMVIILGPVHPSWYEQLVLKDIRPVIFRKDQAEALSSAARKLGKRAAFHFAVDTGMGRIGLPCNADGIEEACGICGLPEIFPEGMFTHFARADETEKTAALLQAERFDWFAEKMEKAGIHIPLKHVSNSAAIIDMPGVHRDIARAGISIYGLYPSEEVEKDRVPLLPVMSLKSRISHIKTIHKGDAISYGGTFVAEKDMVVATIPVGYADGYPRMLSGKGCVLVCGRRARILGRVCMDQFMVDVTDIPQARVWSVVTLIGQDGMEAIRAEEIGDISGRFNYELVCDISKRVPRVYTE